MFGGRQVLVNVEEQRNKPLLTIPKGIRTLPTWQDIRSAAGDRAGLGDRFRWARYPAADRRSHHPAKSYTVRSESRGILRSSARAPWRASRTGSGQQLRSRRAMVPLLSLGLPAAPVPGDARRPLLFESSLAQVFRDQPGDRLAGDRQLYLGVALLVLNLPLIRLGWLLKIRTACIAPPWCRWTAPARCAADVRHLPADLLQHWPRLPQARFRPPCC